MVKQIWPELEHAVTVKSNNKYFSLHRARRKKKGLGCFLLVSTRLMRQNDLASHGLMLTSLELRAHSGNWILTKEIHPVCVE